MHVLDPANAMVHLLDNFVRAPQLAAMVFEDDPDHDVIQVTITDPSVDGLHLRELILPDDVLVMAIARRGHSIVPHGYTNLHLEDEVTLIGTHGKPGGSGAEVGLLKGLPPSTPRETLVIGSKNWAAQVRHGAGELI